MYQASIKGQIKKDVLCPRTRIIWHPNHSIGTHHIDLKGKQFCFPMKDWIFFHRTPDILRIRTLSSQEYWTWIFGLWLIGLRIAWYFSEWRQIKIKMRRILGLAPNLIKISILLKIYIGDKQYLYIRFWKGRFNLIIFSIHDQWYPTYGSTLPRLEQTSCTMDLQ